MGQLQQGGVLEPPEGLDVGLWETTLSKVWDQSVAVQSFVRDFSLVGEVQDQWDCFQQLLVQICVEALNRLGCDPSVAPDVRARCLVASRRRLYKGHRAKHVVRSLAHRGVKHEVGNMAIRKKRHRLARLYELRRLLGKQEQGPLSPLQRVELSNLRNKLSAFYGPGLSWLQVHNHTLVLAQELAALDNQARSQRLRAWRDSLLVSDKSLGRWLKSKINPVGVHLRSVSGVLAEDDATAAGFIVDYWHDFWRNASVVMPPREDRVTALLNCLPALPVVEWSAPSGRDLWLLARKNHGSGGPDTWSGRELCHFPPQVFDCFARLARHWLDTGDVPQQVCEARMCCLPKAGKLDHTRCISVEHMRPITVLSLWWRLWSSAWVQGSELQSWVRRYIPSQFAAVHRVSPDEVAFELMEHLAAHGCLVGLDFTKAYDLLDPFLSCSLLCHLGWPLALVRILEKVWSGVQRWVGFQSAVHPQPLVGPAMPQGDPLGHLIMTLWAWAGWSRVEARSRQDVVGMSRIYIDDRTFAYICFKSHLVPV